MSWWHQECISNSVGESVYAFGGIGRTTCTPTNTLATTDSWVWEQVSHCGLLFYKTRILIFLQAK